MGVPKKFICQFIKFIENKEMVKNDLKFMDEKYVAIYEKSIFEKEIKKRKEFEKKELIDDIDYFSLTLLVLGGIGFITTCLIQVIFVK